MKIRIIILLTVFIGSLPFVAAQRLNKLIYFGYYFDINHPPQILDFRTNPPSLKKNIGIPAAFRENTASIVDKNDSLLFYSNGCEYLDKNNKIIIPKDSFDLGLNNDHCGEGLIGNQGFLVLPNADGSSIILYNSIYRILEGTKLWFWKTKFFVDKISTDLKLERITVLVQDTLASEPLSAVRDTGEGWWIITRLFQSNSYIKYRLVNDTIKSVTKQQIGDLPNSNGSGVGGASFSPDGTKYCLMNANNGVFVYDFNRKDGTLSNPRRALEDKSIHKFKTYGCSFSPNSRYLYISCANYLYQLDTQQEDLNASAVLLDSVLVSDIGTCGFKSVAPNFYVSFLALDCRIYITSTSGQTCFHVIHNPDYPGKACNFVKNGFNFYPKHFNGHTLPAFINDMLDRGNYCDSTILLPVSVDDFVLLDNNKIGVYPNPVGSSLKLTSPSEAGFPSPAEFCLHDMLGRQVLSSKLQYGTEDIDVSVITEGLYIWSLSNNGQIYGQGKLVVER